MVDVIQTIGKYATNTSAMTQNLPGPSQQKSWPDHANQNMPLHNVPPVPAQNLPGSSHDKTMPINSHQNISHNSMSAHLWTST